MNPKPVLILLFSFLTITTLILVSISYITINKSSQVLGTETISSWQNPYDTYKNTKIDVEYINPFDENLESKYINPFE